mgnify:CR=1 FL=1
MNLPPRARRNCQASVRAAACDCAGEIEALSSGVTHIVAGEAAFGLATACLGNVFFSFGCDFCGWGVWVEADHSWCP